MAKRKLYVIESLHDRRWDTEYTLRNCRQAEHEIDALERMYPGKYRLTTWTRDEPEVG